MKLRILLAGLFLAVLAATATGDTAPCLGTACSGGGGGASGPNSVGATELKDTECAEGEIWKRVGGVVACAAEAGAAGGDSVTVDGAASTDPDFRSEGDLNAILCTGAGAPDASCLAADDVLYRYNAATIDATHLATDSVSADELNASGVATELEAVLDLVALQGAVTDSQVPNTITINPPSSVKGGTVSTCARFDGAGELVSASGDCLSGDTVSAPGGADTQVQYNNGAAFGGAANLTYDDTVADPEWSAAPTPHVTLGDGVDEGILQLGNAFIGQADDTVTTTVLDDILIIYNDSDSIEDISTMFISASDIPRFVLAEEGADLATYNPRSLVIGPAATLANVDENILCSTNFTNIDCDTGATGADLGVEDDAEIGGDLYVLGSLQSPTLVTPLLGTPASGVMTNVTGTAAGLTAGNATNAADAALLDSIDSTGFAILAGQAGGQTIIGGTGAGDDITLETTSNGSKGSYIFTELANCDTIDTDAGGVLTCGTDASGGGGTPNVFDIGDDGGDDSIDLVEIATTGDTNSIFTEPTADKMLISVGNNWPTADVAVLANTGDSATAFFSSGEIADAQVSDTLTASLFVGSGSTTTAVDLATAEVAGTLAAASVGNGLTDAQVLDNLTIDLATTVTTNANLTGPITSVGNTTSIAASTGTGTEFVVSIAPTIQGKVGRTGTAVNDDECTGEQGSWWWDSTDLTFEFCNASSGAPAVLGGTGLGSNLSSSTNDILSDVAVTSALVLGGVGAEAITLDFETTANTVGVSSTTGVTTIDFGTINLSAGAITTAPSATPGWDFTDSDAADGEVSARIEVDCTTVTAGANEDCDFAIGVQEAGAAADPLSSAGVTTAQARLFIDADGPTHIEGAFVYIGDSITPVTPDVASAENDLYVEDALEVDGVSNLAGAVTIGAALTATSYGGITEANLVDKSAAEAITGAWDFGAGELELPNTVVASLGTATLGRVAIITDGADADDCTVGAGSVQVHCMANGSTWEPSGDSGAGGGGGAWTDGATVKLNTTTKDVIVGTAQINSAQLSIDGEADQVQFAIQANAAQTANVVEIENSGGTVVASIDDAGVITGTQLSTGTSATPNVHFNDSGGTGEGQILVDGDLADGLMDLQVDDSTGEDTSYIQIDGVNESVEIGNPGTNYVDIDTAGAMTFVGTASIDLPANTVVTADITDLNVTEDKLAATLAFDATDLLDLSGIDASTATEGLILPQIGSACASATGEGQICWDTVGQDLYIGNGSVPVQMNTGGGSMSSFDLDGDNTSPQTITNGNTVLIAGGTNGIDTVASATDTLTINLDLTEIDGPTWGNNTSSNWIFDSGGASDPNITFSDGLVAISAADVTMDSTLLVAGDIRGALNINTSTAADSPTADEMRGVMHIAEHTTPTSDVVYDLPTAAAGLNACFYDNGGGDGGITLVPASGDLIQLDGFDLDVVDTVDSPGVAGAGANGDFICILAIDVDTWLTMGRSGDWVDGGPE